MTPERSTPSTTVFLIAFSAVVFYFGIFVIPDQIPAKPEDVRWGPVTHASNVVARMKALNVDSNAATMYEAHESARKAYLTLRSNIDERISALAALPHFDKTNAEEAKVLLDVRKGCDEAIAQPLPFYVAGFAEEKEIYLQMVNFIALAVLFWLARPALPAGGESEKKDATWRLTIIWMGFLYFFLYEFPFLMRRLEVFGSKFVTGRRSYGFYSFDINRSEWGIVVVQELVMALILAGLWLAWHRAHLQWKTHFKTRSQDRVSPQSVREDMLELSMLFHEWQRNSLILAAAFLPWSYFDWNFTHFMEGGESRFVYMALLDHVTWIGTWVVISGPLLEALKDWKRVKLAALFDTAGFGDRSGSANPKHPKAKGQHQPITGGDPGLFSTEQLELIAGMEPVSNLQLIGASIAAGVSFFVPLLGLLK